VYSLALTPIFRSSILLAFTFSTKFCQENYAYSQNANILDLDLIPHFLHVKKQVSPQ
jgi:hypothetical protein